MRRWTGRRIALALLVGMFGWAGNNPSLHAETVSAEGCVEENTYTFDPPLTTSNQAGTVSMTFAVTCVRGGATTSPFSAGADEVVDSGGGTFSYLGSCTVALMTGGQQHAIFGGTLVVALNSSTSPGFSRKAVVLVPSNPCTDPGGQVSGTGRGPAWSVGVS